MNILQYGFSERFTLYMYGGHHVHDGVAIYIYGAYTQQARVRFVLTYASF
jgi:hypothetical protein